MDWGIFYRFLRFKILLPYFDHFRLLLSIFFFSGFSEKIFFFPWVLSWGYIFSLHFASISVLRMRNSLLYSNISEPSSHSQHPLGLQCEISVLLESSILPWYSSIFVRLSLPWYFSWFLFWFLAFWLFSQPSSVSNYSFLLYFWLLVLFFLSSLFTSTRLLRYS